MIKDVMIVMGSLGFYFDMDRCIGCKTCQIACKEHNKLPVGEFFRRAGTFTCGTPSGEVRFNYSGACNHCAEPACVKNCPTGAYYVRDDGTVGHQPEKCIGCGTCTWACPYGAPRLSARFGVSVKCTSCPELRAQGRQPACVDACLTHCLTFTDLDALPADEAAKLTDRLPILPDPALTRPSLLIKRKEAADV